MRAVFDGPAPQIVPIQAVTLHGQELAHVIQILAAILADGPANLRDDDILCSGKPNFAIEIGNKCAPSKPFLVMWIRTQPEQFQFVFRTRHHDAIAERASNTFERGLRMKLEEKEPTNV